MGREYVRPLERVSECKVWYALFLPCLSVKLAPNIEPQGAYRGIIAYPCACCRPDLRRIKILHISPDIASVNKGYHPESFKEGEAKLAIQHKQHIPSCRCAVN